MFIDPQNTQEWMQSIFRTAIDTEVCLLQLEFHRVNDAIVQLPTNRFCDVETLSSCVFVRRKDVTKSFLNS
jgi:hypothetical protein